MTFCRYERINKISPLKELTDAELQILTKNPDCNEAEIIELFLRSEYAGNEKPSSSVGDVYHAALKYLEKHPEHLFSLFIVGVHKITNAWFLDSVIAQKNLTHVADSHDQALASAASYILGQFTYRHVQYDLVAIRDHVGIKKIHAYALKAIIHNDGKARSEFREGFYHENKPIDELKWDKVYLHGGFSYYFVMEFLLAQFYGIRFDRETFTENSNYLKIWPSCIQKLLIEVNNQSIDIINDLDNDMSPVSTLIKIVTNFWCGPDKEYLTILEEQRLVNTTFTDKIVSIHSKRFNALLNSPHAELSKCFRIMLNEVDKYRKARDSRISKNLPDDRLSFYFDMYQLSFNSVWTTMNPHFTEWMSFYNELESIIVRTKQETKSLFKQNIDALFIVLEKSLQEIKIHIDKMKKVESSNMVLSAASAQPVQWAQHVTMVPVCTYIQPPSYILDPATPISLFQDLSQPGVYYWAPPCPETSYVIPVENVAPHFTANVVSTMDMLNQLPAAPTTPITKIFTLFSQPQEMPTTTTQWYVPAPAL